ncbi:hypothetical protein Dimus_036429, partial [Dionaea muscipula]
LVARSHLVVVSRLSSSLVYEVTSSLGVSQPSRSPPHRFLDTCTAGFPASLLPSLHPLFYFAPWIMSLLSFAGLAADRLCDSSTRASDTHADDTTVADTDAHADVTDFFIDSRPYVPTSSAASISSTMLFLSLL